MLLYGYFRSSASWRVRIALALKGMAYDQVFRHLRRDEHRTAQYLAVNPQGLLPALQTDEGDVLTQSLAICEYLDEIAPDPPLLPQEPLARARVRALAQVIACDIHPVQNLKVLQRLRQMGHSEAEVAAWIKWVVEEGLDGAEALAAKSAEPFASGHRPGLADLCLIPQLNNARRFGVEMRWKRLQSIETACLQQDAFAATAPDKQPDAE
jgi:maleylpyruvate isomerase